VATGAVIFKNDKLLLVKRRHEPKASYWTLPGGVVELGEALETALRREILEECGLQVKPLAIVDVIDYIERDTDGKIEYHYVIIDYEVEIVGGAVSAASDAIEACWFSLNELSDLNLPEITRTFLNKHYVR
jgi:ADP-ribose pyrophosphatase